MQSSLALCMESSAFLIVDLTFHRQWHNAGTMQAPCSGKYDCLVSHPSSATRKGATVEFVKVKCQHLAQMSLDLYSPGSCLRIIYNFGTASYQLPSSELALHGDCAAQRSEFAKL